MATNIFPPGLKLPGAPSGGSLGQAGTLPALQAAAGMPSGLGPIGQDIQSQVSPVNFPATPGSPATLGIPGGPPGVPAAAPPPSGDGGGILQLLMTLLQQPNIQNLAGTAATAAIGGGGRRGAANVKSFQDTFQNLQNIKRLDEDRAKEEEQRLFQNRTAEEQREFENKLARQESERRATEASIQGSLSKQQIRQNAIDLGIDSNNAEITRDELSAAGVFNDTAIGMAVRQAQNEIDQKIPVNILTREVTQPPQQKRLRRLPLSQIDSEIQGADRLTPAELEVFTGETLRRRGLGAEIAQAEQQLEVGEFNLTTQKREEVVKGVMFNIRQQLLRDPTSLDVSNIGKKIAQIRDDIPTGFELPDDVVEEALVRALDSETIARNSRQQYQVNESIISLNNARASEARMNEMAAMSAQGNLFQNIPTAQQEKIFTIVELVNIVDEIENTFSTDYLGHFDSRFFGSLGEATGLITTEHAEFRAKVHSLRNILAKARSGAAVTPAEMKNLMKELPHLSQFGTSFNARLSSFRETLIGALTARGTPYGMPDGEAFYQGLKGGGVQSSGFGTPSSGQLSPGAVEYLNQRGIRATPSVGADTPPVTPAPPASGLMEPGGDPGTTPADIGTPISGPFVQPKVNPFVQKALEKPVNPEIQRLIDAQSGKI